MVRRLSASNLKNNDIFYFEKKLKLFFNNADFSYLSSFSS